MVGEARIVVLGATGMLGSTLVPYLRSSGHNIVTHSKTNTAADVRFDLSDWESSHSSLSAIQPNTIINLVGLTNVELCQEQTHTAYLANTRTVENLVRWIKQSPSPCHLIQISTDHFYSGEL